MTNTPDLLEKIRATKILQREVVQIKNTDGSYRWSIQEPIEVDLQEPGFFRKTLFSFAENLLSILVPAPNPKI